MITKQTVEKLANERIEERNLDIYIVDITIGPSNQIMVELDGHKTGVSIEDCMAVSRNIEHNLDREIEDFSLLPDLINLLEYLNNILKILENR